MSDFLVIVIGYILLKINLWQKVSILHLAQSISIHIEIIDITFFSDFLCIAIGYSLLKICLLQIVLILYIAQSIIIRFEITNIAFFLDLLRIDIGYSKKYQYPTCNY